MVVSVGAGHIVFPLLLVPPLLGQTAPSLSRSAILLAQVIKAGVGCGCSLRQRAIVSTCTDVLNSFSLVIMEQFAWWMSIYLWR